MHHLINSIQNSTNVTEVLTKSLTNIRTDGKAKTIYPMVCMPECNNVHIA